MSEKTCQLCGETKPLSEYHKNKQIPGGKHTICKPCNRSKVKAWKSDNPTKFKTLNYRRKYGLTCEEVQHLRERCNYACEVCGLQESQCPRGILFVDHCHKTGTVRGMLCQKCNTLLGQCDDNIETLKAAITYLRGFAYDSV